MPPCAEIPQDSGGVHGVLRRRGADAKGDPSGVRGRPHHRHHRDGLRPLPPINLLRQAPHNPHRAHRRLSRHQGMF